MFENYISIMKTGLLFITMIAFFGLCEAQSVKRQSIGTIGTTYHSESLTVQQSVGQPYQTSSYASNGSELLPGFIQPVNYSSSIVSTTFSVQINIFPNPATEMVSFIVNENLEDLSLEVYEQTGKLIYREEIHSLGAYKLNCSKWMNGIYMISIKDVFGNSYRSTLVKIK